MIPETDEVFVNRNGTTYKTTAENMADLQDTDLMLVNRDGVTYTVTGEEIKDSIQPQQEPDITSVVLTQNQVNANRYTSNQFTTTVTYAEDPYPPQSVEMTAKVVGALSIEAGTDLITSNDYTGTASTSVPLTLNSDIYLTDGTFEVGDVVKASASHTPRTSSIVSIQADLFSNYSIENGFSSTGGTGAFTVSGSAGSEYFDKANYWSQGQHDTTVTVNFNPPIPFQSSVRVYAWGSRPSHQCRVYTSLGNYVTTNLQNESGDITTKANKYEGTGTISKLVFTGGYANNTGYGLGGIMVDEDVTSLLRVEPTSSSRSGVIGDPTQVLSFNDAQDISLFEAGDLVQAADPSARQIMGNWAAGVTGWTPVSYAGTPINAFDGNDSTYVLAESPTSSNLYWQAKDENGSNMTITNITKLEVNWSVGDPSAFYINGSKVADYPGASGGWRDYSANATSLTSIRIENKKTDGGTASFSGIRINDQYLIDNVYGVLIEETDVLAKTITVDGGTWDVSNQSQVWSSLWEEVAGLPSPINNPELGFDGDLTTVGSGSSTTKIDLSSYGFANQVVEWYNSNGDKQGANLNDEADPTGSGASAVGWYTLGTVPADGRCEITLNGYGTSSYIAGLRIDGRLLVDAAYDDQVWSTGASIPASSVDVGSDKTMAFDGSLSSNYRTLGQNGIISLDFSSFPISYTTSVEVYCTTAGTDANVAGSSASQMPVNSWGTIATGSGTLFGITLTNANAKTSIAAVRVDGKLLIDLGARGIGDNKVSVPSPKQGEGTISDITGSVVTISPYTDNCFKEGQYLTHATPKNIQITPLSDSIDSVSGNTLTLTGSKDLINFSNGDAVTMANADGTAATYNAETSAITSVDQSTLTYNNNYTASSDGLNDANNVFSADDDELAQVRTSGGTIIFSVGPDYVIVPSGATMKIRYAAQSASYWTPTVYGYTDDNATVRQLATVQTPRSDALSWMDVYTNNTDGIAYVTSMSRGSATASGGIPALSKITVEKDGNTVVLLDNVETDSGVPGPTTLNFTDNTDLQYFKVGDDVSNVESFSVSGLAPSNWDDGNASRVFDGSGSTFIEINAGGTYDTSSINPPFIPFGDVEKIEVLLEARDRNMTGTVSFVIDGTQYQKIQPGLQMSTKTWADMSNLNIPNGRLTRFFFAGADGDPNGFIRMYAVRLDGKILNYNDESFDIIHEATVVDPPDLNQSTMIVSNQVHSIGDTLNKIVSGTGVVDSSDPVNSTMTLSSSNDEWLPGYHVTTPEKNVIEKTGYLKFDASGNVEKLSRLPQAAVIMTDVDPVLTFPAQFGTGEVPDTELPYPTFLQTEITAKNTFINGQVNTDTKASNSLYPETNTRSVPASGEKRTTAEGLAQFIANVDTFSGRQAAANTDPTDVQGAFTAAQTDINDYIADL